MPVIDRGPYSGAATLDLTHAAALELGITETVAVGMLALERPGRSRPTNWYPPGAAPSRRDRLDRRDRPDDARPAARPRRPA